jgi:hypothetical protein
VTIAAPRQRAFEVLSEPYLARQTRAIAEKIHILERGSDMFLAAHRTPIRGRLVATTVETVRFTLPSGSTSGWSAGRCHTSSKPSCSPLMAPTPG